MTERFGCTDNQHTSNMISAEVDASCIDTTKFRRQPIIIPAEVKKVAFCDTNLVFAIVKNWQHVSDFLFEGSTLLCVTRGVVRVASRKLTTRELARFTMVNTPSAAFTRMEMVNTPPAAFTRMEQVFWAYYERNYQGRLRTSKIPEAPEMYPEIDTLERDHRQVYDSD